MFGGVIMDFKYYVYVSDIKVDMIYSQISHSKKKKIIKEIKSDLKLFGGILKTETEVEDNRFNKLETVANFIRESIDVGSVESPGTWIAGVLPMVTYVYEESNFVYFINPVEEKSQIQHIIALGGSSKHLIGAKSTVPGSKSSLMYLEREILGVERGEWISEKPTQLDEEDMVFRVLSYDAQCRATYSSAQLVEFLAKNLRSGKTGTGVNVSLATPLYVALAE
jgi:Family of unknown function (DUF7019)